MTHPNLIREHNLQREKESQPALHLMERHQMKK